MLALAAWGPAPAGAISGDEVMRRSLEARNLGDEAYRAYRVELTARDGSTVTRTVSTYRKNCDGASKQLVVFREPSDIAGAAFLSWIHPHRMPDMWLYLPELGRPRQVNAATRGESFLGSDFTYEDLGAPTQDERTHLLVDEPVVESEPTYRIESRPRAIDHYARILTWVRQTSFLPVRVEYFDARDALEKVGRYFDVRVVNGIPTLAALEMANVRTGHRTAVTLLDAEYDRPVDCAIFSERWLSRARP
ncbi:MAG: outer membrane lipoprotein-sorting protein [Deltaproteobacteria bacterium]|nr:outer membrane lipoprotein-sorting protein [Deltaproteobacteria bacterium]